MIFNVRGLPHIDCHIFLFFTYRFRLLHITVVLKLMDGLVNLCDAKIIHSKY